ncbi:hypothetical protein GGS24DRAFT_45750 [Hypoxylon argillaceum]|nr:hypothetical protein GGS24DRAFT_45750 [Hypoxylon argillaceum]
MPGRAARLARFFVVRINADLLSVGLIARFSSTLVSGMSDWLYLVVFGVGDILTRIMGTLRKGGMWDGTARRMRDYLFPLYIWGSIPESFLSHWHLGPGGGLRLRLSGRPMLIRCLCTLFASTLEPRHYNDVAVSSIIRREGIVM